MHIPNQLKMEPDNSATQFIHDNGFGVLISERLEGTHLPFLLDDNRGDNGTLFSHISRVNPHWKSLNGKPVMIIFNGPHSYISPTWYAKGPAVPTWNYAAVHVYGVFEMLPDEQTPQVVQDTVKKYEPDLLANSNVMPAAYQQKLVKAIVSFKVSILKIEAKHKLGQQRRKDDQIGVYRALQSSNDHDANGLAKYMLNCGVGLGEN